jgi:hypothetical protein
MKYYYIIVSIVIVTIIIIGIMLSIYNGRIMVLHSEPFNEDSLHENKCKYVSSYGLLKSCDIRSDTPISSIHVLINYDFSKLKDGCTIYICNTAIPFFSQLINQIHCRFILVSGDSDTTIPEQVFSCEEDFQAFINNEKLIHWYSQNCVLSHHPKLSKIPIGLDYHTMSNKDSDWGEKITPGDQEQLLESIVQQSQPFWEREIKCYSNFHFSMGTKYAFDRKEAIENIPKELVFYENKKINRKETWETQSKYAFVISPHGNGLDCHRTWEALCLGCIVIVKKSGISDLFEGLPVLVVNNWKDVTANLLRSTIENFKNTRFDYDKLTLKYWVEKIKSNGV